MATGWSIAVVGEAWLEFGEEKWRKREESCESSSFGPNLKMTRSGCSNSPTSVSIDAPARFGWWSDVVVEEPRELLQT